MIPSSLDESIKENDVNSARAFFVVQINNERTKTQFEMAIWADMAEQQFLKKGSNFFQQDNEKILLPSDKALWTKDLWSEFRVELEYNFSKFKLNSIIEIMTFLRASGHEDFVPQSLKSLPRANERSESVYNNLDNSAINKTSYKKASVAGAIIGGVSGKIIGLTVTGVVAGAAIGVAYAYYRHKRN